MEKQGERGNGPSTIVRVGDSKQPMLRYNDQSEEGCGGQSVTSDRQGVAAIWERDSLGTRALM